MRRTVGFLIDEFRKRFEGNVIAFVDVCIPDLWKVLWMWFAEHLKRCVGGGVGEAKEIIGEEWICEGSIIKKERQILDDVWK